MQNEMISHYEAKLTNLKNNKKHFIWDFKNKLMPKTN